MNNCETDHVVSAQDNQALNGLQAVLLT